MAAPGRPRPDLSLSPSPMSLLPLQVPLERHDGGIRLGDNQVGSLWSERRGQHFWAGGWRRRRGRGGGRWRRRHGPGLGGRSRQQRRDEPRGAAALPAATGRSRRPSPASRRRRGAAGPRPTLFLATRGTGFLPSSLTFNPLEKVQPPGTPSAPSHSSGHLRGAGSRAPRREKWDPGGPEVGELGTVSEMPTKRDTRGSRLERVCLGWVVAWALLLHAG